VVEIELQSGEKVSMPGNPVKLSEMEEGGYNPPPLLGEHTDKVLSEVLGYDQARIETLRKQGTIQ